MDIQYGGLHLAFIRAHGDWQQLAARRVVNWNDVHKDRVASRVRRSIRRQCKRYY